MNQTVSILFTDICGIYEMFLSPYKPFVNACQSLSLDTKDKSNLTFHYIESYYPSEGYKSNVKQIDTDTLMIRPPKDVSMVCRATLFGFDHYNSDHQDSIAVILEKLKTRLMELEIKPDYSSRMVSYDSSTRLKLQRVEDNFLQHQLELVPLYREALQNLLNLQFEKDLLLQIPKSENALLAFIVNEPEKKYTFNMGIWEGFQMNKEEVDKLVQIITKNELKIFVDDCQQKKRHEDISTEELEKICVSPQK